MRFAVWMRSAVPFASGVLLVRLVVIVVVVPVTRGGSLERSASHFLESHRVSFRVLRLPWHPIDGATWADFGAFLGGGEKKTDRGDFSSLLNFGEIGAALVTEGAAREARGAPWGQAGGALPSERAEPVAVHALRGRRRLVLARGANNRRARGVVRRGGENLVRGVDPQEVGARETVALHAGQLHGAPFALHGVPPERPAGGLELEAVGSRGVPLLLGFGAFVGYAAG